MKCGSTSAIQALRGGGGITVNEEVESSTSTNDDGNDTLPEKDFVGTVIHPSSL